MFCSGMVYQKFILPAFKSLSIKQAKKYPGGTYEKKFLGQIFKIRVRIINKFWLKSEHYQKFLTDMKYYIYHLYTVDDELFCYAKEYYLIEDRFGYIKNYDTKKKLGGINYNNTPDIIRGFKIKIDGGYILHLEESIDKNIDGDVRSSFLKAQYYLPKDSHESIIFGKGTYYDNKKHRVKSCNTFITTNYFQNVADFVKNYPAYFDESIQQKLKQQQLSIIIDHNDK